MEGPSSSSSSSTAASSGGQLPARSEEGVRRLVSTTNNDHPSASTATAAVASAVPTVDASNCLVSEQEDNYDQDDCENNSHVEGVNHPIQPSGSRPNLNPSSSVVNDEPAVPSEDNADDDDSCEAEDQEDSDESEYEYEDEDDTHYAGFLVNDGPVVMSAGSSSPKTIPQGGDSNNHNNNHNEPARIESFQESSSSVASAPAVATAAADSSSTTPPGSNTDSTITTATANNNHNNTTTTTNKKRWREPSRAAVTMSLRAEREKTGGKRRLAADLYKIMMADTEEAGFSLKPKSEDSMDKWTIKLFKFDSDSNLSKDMLILGLNHIELEMSFPDGYPFEPPFVRVVRPRFKRQTGFVMNGALCMELLTNEGWNPVNDIESVIVSIRSLLVVGDGRLQAAVDMTEAQRDAALERAQARIEQEQQLESDKKQRQQHQEEENFKEGQPQSKKQKTREEGEPSSSGTHNSSSNAAAGSYTSTEAQAAYSHLSAYHKKKGWDTSGWWARKG
mmetsp:Transcript_7112/g.10810  ORF Transcript_7112/g.10810 Transcript_7112/m.10810 type:complete len:505 (-) Transcript_7112:103-1617(-)|eukprot:CAMPEP_0195290596 /NCGR_PEP_ID=MMETSP0707-20130614/6400_1 /TAXON_ID=33640 /ORGANISM="Asterionellopsis glacialis, Strain CCMP134" /LENGTH=504 /DNA_ID=CAMNT_0040350745 /DNA_START=103 /DNA_END=1617 /DNA_ORIENTATION=+